MKSLPLLARLLMSLGLMIASTGAAKAMPTIDVMFLIDGSGSVAKSEFRDEKNLVKKIHDDFASYQTQGQANYRYSVINFATNANTVLNFQGKNSVYSSTLIDGIVKADSSSYLKRAVQQALDVFEAQSPSDHLRQMFLFTDGVPNPSSQSPNGLVSALTAAKINTTVLGLKNFNGQGIAPLVSVSSGVIPLTDYKSSHTQAINQRLLQSANTVPEPSSLALVLLPALGVLALRRRQA